MKRESNDIALKKESEQSTLKAKHCCEQSTKPLNQDTSPAIESGEALITAQIIVLGMGIDHCAGLIKQSLSRLRGVVSVDTNIALHRVSVSYSRRLLLQDLQEAVENAGYEIESAQGENTQQVVLDVQGMGSNHCAGLISTSIKRLFGIYVITTNISTHKITVDFNKEYLSAEDIKQAVFNAGYEVTMAQAGGSDTVIDSNSEERYLNDAKRKLWFAAIPTTLIMTLMIPQMFWQPIPGYLLIVALLAFPVVFLKGGMSTHRSAWRSLTNRTANMDVLISMGSLPPYFIGLVGFVYPMTSFIEMASTIMTFHLLGKYLETRAKGRASQAIKRLLTLGAKTATVLRSGKEEEIAISELAVGDIMLVRPGAKVPTDGEVVDGGSHLDESIATGESVPVEKSLGDKVIGATINKEGLIKIRATKVGNDTFLSQVIRLVEQAQGSKVPIQEFADKVTSRFVPGVIVIAFTSFILWLMMADTLRPVLSWGANFLPWVDPTLTPLMAAILATVAVLVIACPCALGLATPTAIMVGSGIGAERGVLIRSGEAIQTLKDIAIVVLDKTGTITEGKPSLTDVITVESFDESQVLVAAASVEAGSEHPLGQAIAAGARAKGVTVPEVEQFKSITARGVEGLVHGQKVYVGSRRLMADFDIEIGKLEEALISLESKGKTAMLVAIEGKAAGLVAVADTIKKDSKSAITALHQMGIKVAMVTGDNERTAKYVAKLVGIDKVLAGVLPEGKVDAIKRLQADYGNRVAMVGDGINDAPALKQANVGIAIGAGADVAIEAADVTLVQGQLSKLVEAIRLSKATFRKIIENLFWAWFYNLAAIPIAALGLLHPMVGVVAMTTSSLTVIGNSILLKKVKLEVKE
ncbi:heavy metal translocating P-type ATPase [Litorilituus lipolyticus]|uniref:Heavy metal translocating P-type ATPase n=1 Tax=Litorilituus lipolyticus TaxID=2491017 RepID=A0A502KKI6_9GAMM|nr:heavy metal translocating P-type ATPase [Litorilituus lipolyticus]TPH12072.1 heavy metal translocating P-type ATPase [Litorilituus lipolyticus]